MTPEADHLDVLVVASRSDFPITAHSLWNLAAYLGDLRRAYLVTDHLEQGRDLVRSVGLDDVTVIRDDDVLSIRERRLPGWYRQQIIKLRAGRIVDDDLLCVLSGDTLLARPMSVSDLVDAHGRPYLYVNRYRYPSAHLSYERRRVRAVAELLGISPTVSLELGDFISDFFCFERPILAAAEGRLADRFGAQWTQILEARGTALRDKEGFGEYTLYALVALELYPDRPPVRICRETHVLQLHSRDSFERASFDARIVHIVDRGLTFNEVAARAAQFGTQLRPARTAARPGRD